MMSKQFALILVLFIQTISAQYSINTRYIYKKRDQDYLSSILSGTLSDNLVVDTDMSSGPTNTGDVSSTTGAIVNTYVSLLASTSAAPSKNYYTTGNEASYSQSTSATSSSSIEPSNYGSMMSSTSASASGSSTASITTSQTTTVQTNSKNIAVNNVQSTGALVSVGIWVALLFA